MTQPREKIKIPSGCLKEFIDPQGKKRARIIDGQCYAAGSNTSSLFEGARERSFSILANGAYLPTSLPNTWSSPPFYGTKKTTRPLHPFPDASLRG